MPQLAWTGARPTDERRRWHRHDRAARADHPNRVIIRRTRARMMLAWASRIDGAG
jgi:hypothetical protein